MADTTTPTAAATPGSVDLSGLSAMDLVSNMLGSNTAKGAALGALMSNVLSQYSAPGGVLNPLDMSKPTVAARNTTIQPTRYVPYSQYGTRDLSAGMSPEQIHQFGGVSGLGSLVPQSALSATPSFLQDQMPRTISSAGSGAQTLQPLSLTPKGSNTISPLTGALLGAAAGFLSPTGGAGGSGASISLPGGGTISIPMASAKEVWNRLTGQSSKPATGTTSGGASGPTSVGSSYDSQGNLVTTYSDGSTKVTAQPTGSMVTDSYGNQYKTYSDGSMVPVDFKFTNYTGGNYGTDTGTTDQTFTPGYGYTDVVSSEDLGSQGGFTFKDGGMASPLMAASGGAIQQPSFYTYGTPVDPRQVMQQAQAGMATGGMAHGWLHVPVVEGRHDYRAGARVTGAGDGQSDDIPAMLADGEYVIDAETVAQLGNGSTKAGSDLLDKFREEIRDHKRSAPVNEIPPPSKSPLQYLKQAQSRSKKHGN